MPWNLTISISHADYTIIVDFEFVTHLLSSPLFGQ
jgi:hypothetical protein